jgi:hypothetical protein
MVQCVCVCGCHSKFGLVKDQCEYYGSFCFLISILFLGVDSFSGIFGDLPKQCFLSNLEIMFTNPLVDTDYPVVVDLQSGNVSVLKDHPHVDILAVGQGFIVGAKRWWTA